MIYNVLTVVAIVCAALGSAMILTAIIAADLTGKITGRRFTPQEIFLALIFMFPMVMYLFKTLSGR